MRAATYTRISRDYVGEGKGVERQAEDVERLCDSKGFTVVARYEDNDVGASGKAKRRPQYEAMLADAEAGKFEVIVAYSNSRLTRRPRELEDLIDLHDRNGVEFITVVSGQDDLKTADGRSMARFKAAMDAAEAERIGERVRRQKQQRAAEGKPLGSRFPVYGYTREWKVIESQATIVREVFERRGAGESIAAIGRDLRNRGEKTVSGIPWSDGTLRNTLKQPLYAGLLRAKGEIVGKSVVPAIIDERLFNLVQSNLVKDSKGSTTRKHLLTGFLVCSKCMTPMTGTNNGGSPQYRCPRHHGGCGSNTIVARWAEEPIFNASYRKWQDEQERPEEQQAPKDDLPAAMAALDERIREAQDAFTEGQITMADLGPMLKKLRAQRAVLQRQEAEAASHDYGILQPVIDYEAMNLSQKRLFIGRYIENVLLLPGKRGRQQQDNGRFEVHFKDGEVHRLTNGVVRDHLIS